MGKHYTRTNLKLTTEERSAMVFNHIRQYYPVLDDLLADIKANIYGNRTVQLACADVIDGGCFAIYYTEVNEILKSWGVDISDNDVTNWSMYKKLMTNRMVKICEGRI